MNALTTKGGLSAIGDGDKKDAVVNQKIRTDWNDYVNWLQSKNLKGHPSLDRNDLGGQMIDQYRKINPTTTVSRDTIKPIQQEFSKYRDWVLNSEVPAKRAVLAAGTTPDNFMKSLSIVDGVPGQRTTSFQFPLSYLKTFENGQLTSNQNLGFATTNQ